MNHIEFPKENYITRLHCLIQPLNNSAPVSAMKVTSKKYHEIMKHGGNEKFEANQSSLPIR